MSDDPERFKIDADPEDVLRALLNVDAAELPPKDERCPVCGGVGYNWEPAAVTAPPQPAAWQLCRECNGTGLEAWTKNTPRRQRPAKPPAGR